MNEIASLKLHPDTHKMLRSAKLDTFNSVFQTSDLELYRLFHNDLSKVRQVRDVIAQEMKRLGHWKPRPGEPRKWSPVGLYEEQARVAGERARVATEQAKMEQQLAEERRIRRAAEDAEHMKRQAAEKAARAAGIVHLKRLGFSTRTANCLYDEGLLTIEAITRVSDKKLMQIPNFGKASLIQVRAVVPVPAKPRIRIKAWTSPYQPPMSNEQHAF